MAASPCSPCTPPPRVLGTCCEGGATSSVKVQTLEGGFWGGYQGLLKAATAPLQSSLGVPQGNHVPTKIHGPLSFADPNKMHDSP